MRAPPEQPVLAIRGRRRTTALRVRSLESGHGAAGRPRVEAAAHFCVVEAVHNLGEPVVVVLDARVDQLQLNVRGTDRGGLPVDEMRDRVEAAGGSVSIAKERGRAVIDVRAPSASPVF